MHTVPVARKVSLSALVALVLLAGALFVAVPKASANRSDCPSNYVCFWAGQTYGSEPRAFFHASDTGYKPLNNINPGSIFNNTSNRIVSLDQWPYSVLWPQESVPNLGAYPGGATIS
jgi:hypothetical protein